MAQNSLVTVGSDGFTDWVKLPDGARHNLGTVSVLKFVVDLAPRAFTARTVLDEFLANGHAMMSVDLDRMWELIKPRRSRWAADSPLIPRLDRTSQSEPAASKRAMGDIMAESADSAQAAAIKNQIAQIEEQIGIFQKKVQEAGSGSLSADLMNSQIESLKKLIGDLRAPAPYGDQANNSNFYPSGEEPKMASGPSYDTFKAHSDMAESIVARVHETDTQINKLVEAGKKFDAPRAKQDLHKIASKVAEIAENVDLAQPWLRGDLEKLSAEADRIHGLFAPAKV